uniref:Uncharacterized protein n=1 Tax=Acrobeloides nanus TaxID=290746 RepID=A0A914D816_9BILA
MCTTSFPRQMIEVHSENPDEDEHKSTPSNSQKKLRALLMQIENASLTLLECESIRHRLEKTEPTETNDLLTTLNSKLETIMTSVVTDEHLPMVMIIQKGRHFLGRLIEFSDTESRKEIFKAILDGVPKFSKKMDADAQSNSLLTSLSNAISQLKNEDFYSFFEAWKMSQIGALLTIQ